MTDDLLQSVDSRAKQEDLLKEGEDIMTYSSMKELIAVESLAKGIEKGKAEGKVEGKAEVALRMLEQNMDMSLIVRLTGLSMQELQQLKR